MMRGYQSTLQRHCLRQHSSENAGFMADGAEPRCSKYLNVQQYLQDPTVELVEDPAYKKKLAGRPRKLEARTKAAIPTASVADQS